MIWPVEKEFQPRNKCDLAICIGECVYLNYLSKGMII